MKNKKNFQNNQKTSKNESKISKPETARERAKKRWEAGLTSEQIEKHIKNRIKREIEWYRPLIKATAIKYSQFGWPVIPINPKTKVPCIKWKQYQTKPATPLKVKAMFEEFPEAQIGIVTGSVSGLAVVDFDGEGVKELFEAKFGKLAETIVQSTGRNDGGSHYLFRYPAEGIGSTSGKILKNADIKGDRGYFIVAPSIHKSGRHYEWVNFDPIKDGLSNLAEFPEKILRWNRYYQQSKNSPTLDRSDLNPLEILKGVPVGRRNDTLFRYACRLNTQGLSGGEIGVLVRQANDSSEKPLPESEIQSLMKSALRYQNNGNASADIIPVEIKLFTASEIITSEFPEPKWAIPGILPEGLNILAGKPKIGKSMLALNVCIAVARGQKALNYVDVERGTVIYLALEDTPRRLQRRLREMMPKGQAWIETNNLLIARSWPRMGEGGLRELEHEIKKHSDMRLVIIDTFVKFKPITTGKFINQYEIDYKYVSNIKDLADENEISVLLIHHLRKTDSDDVFDTFSGTFGITGAADGLLALIKSKDSTELHITGRDLENEEYALKFESHNLSWEIIGKAEDVQSSKVKQQVFDVLQGTNATLSPKDLSDMTGIKKNYIQKALIKLIGEGKIDKEERGKYKKKRV